MATNNGTGGNLIEYVTVTIDEHLFGLPIARVQDVFVPEQLTRVPLAIPEIAGVLNLRGRIVTAIDMRRRLGLPPRQGEAAPIAVGIEMNGESYGLLVDAVGEVMQLAKDACEPKPINLDRRLAELASGVHRLDGQLLVVLDVDRVFDLDGHSMAA
ncbi:MAG TPA: chemotaxis protein CheW [Xanthobacteraceae bacterium]|jgi:purine-binding chemotaxis protein CheW|nr:chemotaxis protein CheW [Xanthobacteraceae bacterium]